MVDWFCRCSSSAAATCGSHFLRLNLIPLKWKAGTPASVSHPVRTLNCPEWGISVSEACWHCRERSETELHCCRLIPVIFAGRAATLARRNAWRWKCCKTFRWLCSSFFRTLCTTMYFLHSISYITFRTGDLQEALMSITALKCALTLQLLPGQVWSVIAKHFFGKGH